VPLIVARPGQARGVVRKELISQVDLPATWLHLANAPVPAKRQGVCFRGLLNGSVYRRRDAVFSERNWHDNFDPIRSVRTERHKLIFKAVPHFPYRPAWDLEGSPTWKTYLELGRKGKLSAAHGRLVQPTRPMIELYDLETDPDEFHNLATSAAHAGARQDLQRKLGEWMEQTYDYLPPTAPGWPGRL